MMRADPDDSLVVKFKPAGSNAGIVGNSYISSRTGSPIIELCCCKKSTHGNHLNFVIKVLAHECAHIQQFNRGDLRITSDHRFIWRGTDCGYVDMNDTETYLNNPWEVEANERETSDFLSWKQFLNETSNSK